MKNLLDVVNDGLSEEEEELLEGLSVEDANAIHHALALRTAIKAQSINKGLYLSDSSIDALTAALLAQ